MTTPQVYPTSFDFIMCERVITDVRGKVTFDGVYAGRKLRVPVGASLGLQSLCLVWIFTDGAGSFSEHCEVIGPTGETWASTAPGRLQITASFLLQRMEMNRTPLLTPGLYWARFSLDSRPYERSFEVVEDPSVRIPGVPVN